MLSAAGSDVTCVCAEVRGCSVPLSLSRPPSGLAPALWRGLAARLFPPFGAFALPREQSISVACDARLGKPHQAVKSHSCPVLAGESLSGFVISMPPRLPPLQLCPAARPWGAQCSVSPGFICCMTP